MKLNKALKLKNSLVGKISTLKNIFIRENSRRDDSKSTIDREKLYKQINDLVVQLVELKSAISKANVGIYSKIAYMEELKTQLKFFDSIPVKEGDEVRYLGGDKTETHVWNAYLTTEKIDQEKQAIQREIEATQDVIDEFNATNVVDFVLST